MTTVLPPDSYTARRLEHATPGHLHATTRRTFIGPIPEGWLKSHRKQWFRRAWEHGGNRAPTFRAAHPIASADSPVGQSSGHAQADADAAAASEQPSRPSSQSALTQATQGAVGTPGSTTSLLREQRGSSAPQSSARHERGGTDTRQTDGAPLQHPLSGFGQIVRITSAAGHVAKAAPKVHFSEPTRYQLRMRAQRLAARGTFRNSKIKDGEVLRMDRMLVRVDITQQSVGTDFDEKISASVETKSMDKWREYMIVCRKHAEEDAEGVLQLYKTRVIAVNAAHVGKAKKKPKAQVLLSPRRTGVNLYSSLDKTLCVWTTANGRTTIYYLRPQTGATSVDWYTFLRGMLGWKRARTLQVNVPDLDVRLRLDDPFKAVETSQILAASVTGDDAALARAVNEEKGAAGTIIARCIDMLQTSPEWADVLKAWAYYGRIGLAWKRYDRLEWVHGAVEQRMYGTVAMQRTHDLELRPKQHYPLTAKTRKGDTLQEPLPIEGFLIRLTSQKGHEQRLGKMLFKRLYFTTQNQHLLFLRPSHATPPAPPRMRGWENSNVPSSKQLANQMPLTYNVDPYPLDEDGRITWLDEEGARPAYEQRIRDADAGAEADRNAKILLNCDGFVDMCDIKRIRTMHRGAAPLADENLEYGSEAEFDVSENPREQNSRQDDGDTAEVEDERIFELLMKNGLVIRLQAYDRTARDEWMRRLRELVRYWKHRAREDMDLFKSVRRQNLDALKIDERAEAMVGSFAYKWEVSQSYASPTMYHMCGISQCRTIHLSGLLFRKPRRHTTFTRCRVILSHGHLLIFQDILRARSGKKLEHSYHERIASIDLEGCYLYSGLLTENDLLYRNRTFDSDQPGHHTLPRIFLEDNWTSTDEDAMTTFVIWHAKSKSWFRSSKSVDDVRLQEHTEEREKRKGRKTKLTRVSQLGATGRSVVFKARSRAERDQWVTGIQAEIERLVAREQAEGDDVRLVEDTNK